MNVQFINPDQCQRALAICWAAKVPLNIVGTPGVGKTSAVEQFVARIRKNMPDFSFWPCILAMKGVEDFGLPSPSKTGLAYLFPDDMPIGKPDAKGLLFLDEWDRCPDPAVQNAAMQLTLGGHFHGTEMSKDVYTVLAMNGTSDIHTSPVSEAARTRMVHLYVGTSAAGYWPSWNEWANDAGVQPELAGFVNSRNDLFRKEEEYEELSAFNPRTGGTILSKLLYSIEASKIRTDDIELPLIAGAIGTGAAVEFIAYRKIWKDLPDIDNILRNPDTAPVPDVAGIFYALGMALSRKLDGNGTAKKILTYVKRWPEEPSAFCVGILRARQPNIVTLKEYEKWANIAL